MKRLYTLNHLSSGKILASLGYPSTYISKHSWKYDYVITALLESYCNCVVDDMGYSSINTKDLEQTLKQIQYKKKRERAYTRIREDLESVGIIRYFTRFDPNLRIKVSRYKIADVYLANGWTSIPISQYQSIIKQLPAESRIPYSYIQEVLQRITIEEKEARAFAWQAYQQRIPLKPKKVLYKLKVRRMNIKVYSCWLQQIDNLIDQYYFFHADQYGTGRVYNTITSFPKLLRPFLRLNNQALIEVDVSNCQPLVFVLMLREWVAEQGLSNVTDVDHYQRLCELGQFYDYLIKLMQDNGETPDEDTFKIDFFSKVFFSTEKKKYRWRTIFEKQFPTVSQCITALKTNGHNQVAIQLQRKEAEIVVGDAYRRLYADHKITDIFPIHDAILTTLEHKATVAATLVNAFQRVGLQASIKNK